MHETGVYQVWVNHGAGMLGSEPYVASDLGNACSMSGTQTPESVEDQRVIGYYDLLGRQVALPVEGGVYLVR